MPTNDKWVYSSSGRHMFVSFFVNFLNSGPGFISKINYGNIKINNIKIVNQKQIYFQLIVQM